MHTSLLIESLGVYLPEQVMATRDVVQACARPLLFPLEELTGIRTRHVVGPGEYAVDLARKAVVDCLARSTWRPEQIDLVLCCNIARLDGPESFSLEPSTAARLVEQMNLQPVLAFDINNACAGMFTGLYVAELLIRQRFVRNALVVSGEYITALMRTAQREIDGFMDPRVACLTVGDAGAALLVEPASDPNVGLHELDLYTLSRYSGCCVAKSSHRAPGGPIMLTDAVRLTAISVRESIAHAMAVQRRTGFASDWCDHLIPHQTSKTSLTDGVREAERVLADAKNLSDKVLSVVEECGNTATTSHSVALMQGIRQGRVKSGDRILFRVSGSGFTVGAGYYTLDSLPDRVRLGQARDQPSLASSQPRSRQRLVAKPVRVAAQHVALRKPGEDSIALATRVARKALSEWPGVPAGIGLVLHAGVHRTDFLCEPAVAALIAGRLQINPEVPPDAARRTFTFDVLNGAVGFLNACEIATHYLAEATDAAALVVAAEVTDDVTSDRTEQVGLVECGSAWVLAPGVAGGFGAFAVHTLPAHVHAINSAVGYGGERVVATRHVNETWLESACEHLPAVVAELLDRQGWQAHTLRWLIAPPLPRVLRSVLADRLHVAEQCFVGLDAVRGDWFTSLAPHAFAQLALSGAVQPGDRALILSCGSGLTIACVTYTF